MNLYNGNVLNLKLINQHARRVFDPTSIEDRQEFKVFLEHSKWTNGYCPFALEFPYLDIPTMIHNKLSRYFLSKV